MPMCWRCDEINKKTERYRILTSRITDERTLTALEHLIAELEATKKEFHPDEAGR